MCVTLFPNFLAILQFCTIKHCSEVLLWWVSDAKLLRSSGKCIDLSFKVVERLMFSIFFSYFWILNWSRLFVQRDWWHINGLVKNLTLCRLRQQKLLTYLRQNSQMKTQGAEVSSIGYGEKYHGLILCFPISINCIFFTRVMMSSWDFSTILPPLRRLPDLQTSPEFEAGLSTVS